MKETTKLVFAILTMCGIAYGSYSHGIYVGQLDAQADMGTLQAAGFVGDEYVDGLEPARWSN